MIFRVMEFKGSGCSLMEFIGNIHKLIHDCFLAFQGCHFDVVKMNFTFAVSFSVLSN